MAKEKKKKKEQEKPVKKEKKKAKKEEKKAEQREEVFYVDEIMPVVGYNEKVGAFVMEDGSLMDMFSILTKNLNSASEDTVMYDILGWDRLLRTYDPSIKIISFNFPSDTSVQQEYIEKILRRTKHPVFKEQLETELAKLKWIGATRKDRDFALLFFAKDEEDFGQQYMQIYAKLSNMVPPLIQAMEPERKKQIIRSLYNKCSML